MPLAIDELHRKSQSAIAYDIVANRRSLAAMGAAIDRTIEIGLLADPNVIRDLGDYRATHRAMCTDILAQRHRGAGGRRSAGFGHAHTSERKDAKPREATGHETRTAQKGSAVNPTVGLTGPGYRSAAAARGLPIWSPGEHSRGYFPG
jgi:hypothetical protein